VAAFVGIRSFPDRAAGTGFDGLSSTEQNNVFEKGDGQE
jgi:hypothetical protein